MKLIFGLVFPVEVSFDEIVLETINSQLLFYEPFSIIYLIFGADILLYVENSSN